MEYFNLVVLLVAILGGLSIAVIAILTDHKQKMFMVEKGLTDSSYSSPGLRSGLTFSFLGAASILLLVNIDSLLGIPWYAPGVILISLGISQLTFYLISRRDMRQFQRTSALKSNKELSS